MAEIPVTILVEHHDGEEEWTAHVPLIENCFADGPTPEKAAQAVIPEIEYFVEHHPELREVLEQKPEFRLLEVKVNLDDQPSTVTPNE